MENSNRALQVTWSDREEKKYEHEMILIGIGLTELRKKKGYIHQGDFAEAFDLPRVQYWRMEKGRTNFTFRSLLKILTIHGITMKEFFSGVKKRRTGEAP